NARCRLVPTFPVAPTTATHAAVLPVGPPLNASTWSGRACSARVRTQNMPVSGIVRRSDAHRRRLARQVHEVSHLPDALHSARLALELVQQLGRANLAAQEDASVLGVDVDLPLRDACVAEDLRLDLAREGHVIHPRLLLLTQVRRALREAGAIGGRDVRRPPHAAPPAPEEGGDPVAGLVTPPLARSRRSPTPASRPSERTRSGSTRPRRAASRSISSSG